MAGLSNDQVALLTARVGVARLAAIRTAFAPARTDNDTPGGSGPRPIWDAVILPSSTWTEVVTV